MFRISSLRGKIVPAIITILFLLMPILITSSSPPAATEASTTEEASPSVEYLSKLGLSGRITAPLTTGRLTEDGKELVFVGTTDGLYIVSDGVLVRYIYIPFGVSHIQLINDISGDGAREIVLSLDQTDVPAIRCYDGVTGKRLWQSATRQTVYVENVGWSDLQLGTNDMAIAGGDASEIILVSTGRYVFGIDARTGTNLWSFQSPHDLGQFAVVADLDGDGVDDVSIGSEGGHLYLLSGRTGKVKWDTRIAEKYIPRDGLSKQTAVTSLDVYDRETGKVAAASGDGYVRLIDLRRKTVEWEVNLVSDTDELPARIRLAVTPDATTDGKPDVVATVDSKTGNFSLSSKANIEAKLSSTYMLDGNSGVVLWQNERYFWPDSKLPVTIHDNKALLIEMMPFSKINLINLDSGNFAEQIAIPSLDGKGLIVQQTADNSFAAVSNNSDLVLLKSDGTVRWYYPRIASVSVIEGILNDYDSDNILAYGSSPLDSIDKETVRVISLIDGNTHQNIWRYEVPYTDFYDNGGLTSIQSSPDLTADGVRDIVALRGQKIFCFNVATGKLSTIDTGNDIRYVENMKSGPDTGAIIYSAGEKVSIIDESGKTLWTANYSEWSNASPGQVRVMDDINNDDTSDLAMIFSDRIVIMESKVSSELHFDILQTILPEEDMSISFIELTADMNLDGIREIAYYESDKKGRHSPGNTGDTNYIAMVIVSPTGKDTLLRLPMDRQASFKLASGDFDGDGIPDTLAFWGEKSIASPYSVQEASLEVFAGSTGQSLWHFEFDASDSGTNTPNIISITSATGSDTTRIPATVIHFPGINGRDFLALSTVNLEEGMFSSRNNIELSVYDLTKAVPVMQKRLIPVKEKFLIEPMVKDNFPQYSNASIIPGPELISMDGIVHNEWLLAIPTSQQIGTIYMNSTLGFFDIASGRPAGFFPFAASDFFATTKPDTVGIAASGGIYILHLDKKSAETEESLKILLPEAGRTASSPVRIAWESKPGSADIFVDGIKYTITDQSDIHLSIPTGAREVVIRHIDEDGRISYATVNFKVKRFPIAAVTGFTILTILLILYVYPGWVRSRRNRIAQEGM